LPWFCERSSLDDTDGAISIWYMMLDFEQDFALDDAIGSNACSLEGLSCV
jgi:hypothetical protein